MLGFPLNSCLTSYPLASQNYGFGLSGLGFASFGYSPRILIQKIQK